MGDVKERLANRAQTATERISTRLRMLFDVDYAMLVKLYGPSETEGKYSPSECLGTRMSMSEWPSAFSTSYAERQNLTMRMCMRRFTRLTNGFSKKLENHIHMLSLYFVIIISVESTKVCE